jgi:DNA repair exonuclease SbcCD ATPase subunit
MTNLHLSRLRVEQLRQFRQPYVLDGLTPGLNVFSGPNEAGKSTLVRAIRAAFFERHRSTSVDDLKPWGDSSASPMVEIDFSLHGENCQLTKSFFTKKRCNLRIGTKTMEGVEAEDYLADLFGFGFAGKGASRAEHWGIPGLLWVEQGSGQELDVSPARDHLRTALGSQVQGGVAQSLAATGGDELLARLQEKRGELLTQTGRPRATYAEVCAKVDALTEELSALQMQIGRYQQQVDDLARLRSEHAADEQQKPWEALETQLTSAQAKQAELQGLQQRLSADQAASEQLTQTRELLINQLAGFDQQEANAKDRAQAVEVAQSRRDSAKQTCTVARQQLEQAKRRGQLAKDALKLSRQEANRTMLLEQISELTQTVESLQQTLEKADATERTLTQLRKDAASKKISKADVKGLADRDQAVREIRIKLDSVATRIQFALVAGAQIQVDSEGLSKTVVGQDVVLLHNDAELALPGLGVMRIRPGGDDLAELSRELEEAQQELQGALQSVGVADVASAQQRLQEYGELTAQVKLEEQSLNSLAPKGLAALREQKDTAEAKASQAADALARLPERGDALVVDEAEAELEQDASAEAEQTASESLKDAELAQATVDSRLEQASTEWSLAKAVLDEPNRALKRNQCSENLVTNQAEQRTLQTRIDSNREQLGSANADFVAQVIQRLKLSVQQLKESHKKRQDAILLLQNTLEITGAQGLEERQQELAGELERATRRQSELARRAAALTLLCEKLEAKRHDTLQRLQEPLVQRIKHYLQLLFPGATMELDEGLSPETLVRQKGGGQLEMGDVQALSFGAREQLGIISRFAYADLLAAAGKPTLLILDDALVHSDEMRLAQMKRVIYDASQRHQVLLFTCNPNAWRDVGAPIRGIGLQE